MPAEETVDVAPSEDNGNVPLDAPSLPTPAEPKASEATPKEPATPAEPVEPVLYDLPDGRKVDAETLQKEWKENFLPDYTRKSQELAKLEKVPDPNLNNQTPKNNYADPNYVPQTYEEIIQESERRALEKFEAKEKAAIEARQQVETAVANEIAELKKADPNLNVDSLFNHAVKYNFNDLTVAYKNMKDMANLAKSVQTETVKNIQKRADPVSTKPGATGTQLNPRSFSSAVDYLRARSGQQ